MEVESLGVGAVAPPPPETVPQPAQPATPAEPLPPPSPAPQDPALGNVVDLFA